MHDAPISRSFYVCFLHHLLGFLRDDEPGRVQQVEREATGNFRSAKHMECQLALIYNQDSALARVYVRFSLCVLSLSLCVGLIG